MKKKLICIVILFTANTAMAGFNGVTHHSRANCANNESISWDWTHNWYFWMKSQHIHANGANHTLATGWVNTWRAAVVHWGEGRGGWYVEGWHWMLDRKGNSILVAHEGVVNFSIYDVWWDRNK